MPQSEDYYQRVVKHIYESEKTISNLQNAYDATALIRDFVFYKGAFSQIIKGFI